MCTAQLNGNLEFITLSEKFLRIKSHFLPGEKSTSLTSPLGFNYKRKGNLYESQNWCSGLHEDLLNSRSCRKTNSLQCLMLLSIILSVAMILWSLVQASNWWSRWSAVNRHERYRVRCGGEFQDKGNPIPEWIDPITLEPVVTPAISPFGHIMGMATWKVCFCRCCQSLKVVWRLSNNKLRDPSEPTTVDIKRAYSSSVAQSVASKTLELDRGVLGAD